MEETSKMSTLEFLSWSVLVAGLMFYADVWWTQENQSKQQHVVAKHAVTKQISHTKEDKAILCGAWDKCMKLAEVIVYEARSEPVEGKRLVAQVVLNRIEHPRWPDTLEEVVHQPSQFSYVQDMHKQRTPRKEDWTNAKVVAYNVLHGLVEDKSDGAVFYHQKSIKPFWAKHVQLTAQVENHVFYKLK